ncbi:D-alanine-D-alanine ligase [Caldicoprobacter guelmensis]|uniref:D-alanine--D-alanine ligase family protein n=1 Tax=Caldicoprobacter guelmensis TaxID=1170224 RepID=UPI001958CFF8|nr:D-alanine--D-alanine ligase family protein [Caldicoprobacter guelmensis]MBM7582415.1 D-alanine-D-alanine ligase [Caldicoprobacter guelmensis]
MSEKLKVAILFGGQSGEHEVSLMSCTSVVKNMDRDKYDIYFIGITKTGKWLLFEGDVEDIQNGKWEAGAQPIVFPGDPSFKGFFLVANPSKIYKVDVVFPIMHGPHAEDGTIQGLLELANIPYVGCDVVASSVAMDKAMAKAVFDSFGLPQGKYLVVLRQEFEQKLQDVIEAIESKLGYPCFVKPSNMGSSVGITKAHDRQELIDGLKEAGRYDRKIVVEAFINCREIECAVLGNNDPQASVLGEIIPCNEFYDYNAKYFDDGKSRLIIPADLPQEKTQEIRQLAIKAYKALDCSGMARVDFFVEKDTLQVFINEVNTIPGFTRISMYPKLWEATGVPYSRLIDRLIELAMDRFKEKHPQ